MPARSLTRMALVSVTAFSLAMIWGCDNGGSAVESRDRTIEAALPVAADPAGPGPAAATRTRPPITANRRETVEDKITRLYQRNGAAFGARSAEDYLARMKAFVENPPRDVETARRPNGDTLYYQAATNTFAVAARDGTPRTMFKPDNGSAYWIIQKERAPDFGRQGASPTSAPD
ncbi:S-type pyocin family protein [uncultured Brevundimonas sp.]|uniref:S-type pyocin family protein n=1 Tax=uncultured Brevundimonas sp. TaxID=213418 RepID=UPI0030EDAAD2